MFLNDQYEIGNDECLNELKSIRDFVVAHYRHSTNISQNFKKEIVNASKNIVLYTPNGSICLFMNYSINNKTNSLIVHLLVANISQVLIFALGVVIYELLNNGIDSLVYHVHSANSSMLDLSKKGNIPEVLCTKNSYKEFKCSTIFLINKYRHYYHRFICNLHLYNYAELIHVNGEVYVNRSIFRMHSIHDFVREGKRFYYLTDWDLSIHGTDELLPHVYANTVDGFSTKFQRYLTNKYKRYPNTIPCTEDIYEPIDMFIFPTFACNLRCRYCYAEATPAKNINLPFEIGTNGIDFLFKNAQRNHAKHISISFHGGGEPTMNIDLMIKLVKYAEKRSHLMNIPVKFSMSTNGTILNDKILMFIQKCDSVQFSFDGTEEIQNVHRPFANNHESFSIVESNIRDIHQKFPQLKIIIRSTISNLSVGMMVKFVEYFRTLGVTTIVYEPLIVTGRAKENKALLQAPNMIMFSKQIIAAMELGRKLGVNVRCSADSIFRSCHFCGATNSNFILTPNGAISTCVEVSDPKDPLADIFIIGKVSTDRVYVDKDKLQELRKRGLIEHPECRYCIAEKSCRGNCPTRAIRNSGESDEFLINELCIMQTRLFLYKLVQLHSDFEKEI